ncbi:MAG: hypothetical protein H6896_08100 [Rhodovulum sp.]|nr:hypothetical protein [Rhodovulum sp.]
MRYPHDLLALQSGHLMDFFRAGARDLRDRIARALPQWDADRPGYSVLLGMHAFGLEECGDYARAEATGGGKLDRQPLDAWAHHAVAHVMEMQGRAEEGIAWMASREARWSGDDAFFRIHNWWHKALSSSSEAGAGRRGAGALRRADPRLAEPAGGQSRRCLGAALAHRDRRPRRGGPLAGAGGLDRHADGKLYPSMTVCGHGLSSGEARGGFLRALLAACCRAGSRADRRWLLARGDRAADRGFRGLLLASTSAVSLLFGARQIANSFGGSHAQRDVID